MPQQIFINVSATSLELIEHERDEDLGSGAPPQLPAGNIMIINLSGEFLVIESDNQGGLVTEKIEGITLMKNTDVLIVNDNDSKSETQLLNLGDIL
jgi:hypothetical protein